MAERQEKMKDEMLGTAFAVLCYNRLPLNPAFPNMTGVGCIRGQYSIRHAVCKNAMCCIKHSRTCAGKLKELGNTVLGKFGMSLDNFKADKDPNTGSYSINFKQ